MSKFNVYMFLNQIEEPLYIGISKTLTVRIEKQHFISKSGNLSKECIEETYKILYHQATSADDMKIKERYLINTLNPKYNDKMNNGNDFDYPIPVKWEVYEFKKEELLKRRKDNETKTHLKFRNYNYNFENQKILKLNSDRTIRTFDTCILNLDKYYPNIEFPERNRGGHNYDDNFSFLKVNNELYVYTNEILHNFYDVDYPFDGGDIIIKLKKDIKELRAEYGLYTFVIVSSKEKKGIFGFKKSNELLFMKYEALKASGFLDKEWENLLDKALINYKKSRYNWLIGRSYTKEEEAYSEILMNEEINKLRNSYKKVGNVIYLGNG